MTSLVIEYNCTLVGRLREFCTENSACWIVLSEGLVGGGGEQVFRHPIIRCCHHYLTPVFIRSLVCRLIVSLETGVEAGTPCTQGYLLPSCGVPGLGTSQRYATGGKLPPPPARRLPYVLSNAAWQLISLLADSYFRGVQPMLHSHTSLFTLLWLNSILY